MPKKSPYPAGRNAATVSNTAAAFPGAITAVMYIDQTKGDTQMEKYNQYSYNYIKKLISAGQEAAKKGWTTEELAYNTNYDLSEFEFVSMGFSNPDFIPGEIREFYRIGEPDIDMGGTYQNSYNFADDRRENGVSVVTTAWLNSMKSVFFNTTDEKIAARGVYKIRGFAVPGCGGDDETLICPMGWAEKTKIRTRSGLARAVKSIGM